MKNFILRWLILTGVIFALSYFLPSLIKVKDIQTAFLAALILALLNAFVRPVLVVVTLPLRFLTLGAISLVINALLLYAVSYFLAGSFTITGAWQAVAAAFIIGFAGAFFSSVLT